MFGGVVDGGSADDPFSAQPFQKFCVLCEKISSSTIKAKDKAELVANYLRQYPKSPTDFFPVVRLLLPALDRDRVSYGIREAALAKIYADVFGLPDAQARQLRFYRDPGKLAKDPNAPPVKVGDFPSVLYSVLRQRVVAVDTSLLRIGKVNEMLQALCEATDTPARVEVFRQHLDNATALHHKWVARIILKDLKLGLGHDRILALIDPGIPVNFRTTGDLQATMDVFRQEFRDKQMTWAHGTPIQTQSQIELFKPLRPMLAQRLKPEDVASRIFARQVQVEGKTEMLPMKQYYLEPKLDGERIICHFSRAGVVKLTEMESETEAGTVGGRVEGGGVEADPFSMGTLPEESQLDSQDFGDHGLPEVKFYTRKGNHEYPSAYVPHFTSILDDCLKVDQCILDGELLCYNQNTETLLPFGSARTVGAGGIRDAQLYYVVFDVLLVTNKGKTWDMTGQTLRKRKDLLSRIFEKQIPFRLEIVKATLAESPEQIKEVLRDVVESRGEGIMLKEADGRYWPGARNKGWFKTKPNFGWLNDSLDLIVMGAFLSEGTRRRKEASTNPIDHLTTFLMGSLSSTEGVVDSFAKVGTGYSLEELRELIDILQPHLKEFKPYDKPPDWWGAWDPKGSTRPDYIVDRYDNTVALECIGAEIVASDAFGLGYTLRFPRVRRFGAIRKDKPLDECESSATLVALGRGELKHTGDGDVNDSADSDPEHRLRHRQKFTSARKRPDLFLPSQMRLKKGEAAAAEVKFETPFLQGIKFCVLPFSLIAEDSAEYPYPSKPVVELIIQKAGGSVVQNVGPASMVDHVVANAPSIRSKNLNKAYDLIVFNLAWLKECADKGEIVHAESRHVIHPSQALRQQWEGRIDEYGLDLQEDINPKRLAEVLKAFVHSRRKSSAPIVQELRALVSGQRPRLYIVVWDEEKQDMVAIGRQLDPGTIGSLIDIASGRITGGESTPVAELPEKFPLGPPHVRLPIETLLKTRQFLAESWLGLQVMRTLASGAELSTDIDSKVAGEVILVAPNEAKANSWLAGHQALVGRLTKLISSTDRASGIIAANATREEERETATI